MRKLKLFFACLLMAVLSIGQVWATEDPVEITANFQCSCSEAGTSPDLFTATGGSTGANYYSFAPGSAIISNNSYDVDPSQSVSITMNLGTYGGYESGKNDVSFYLVNGNGEQISTAYTSNFTAKYTSNGGKAFSGSVTLNDGQDGKGVYFKFVPVAASGSKYARFHTLSITYTPAAEEVPSYTITAQSNDNSKGTVSLSGSVITGSPKAGFRYASPAYSVSPANSATVSQNGNAFTVTPSANTTVTINFEAIPQYTVTWNNNGTTSTSQVYEGAKPEFPATPASCDATSTTFVGWATAPWTGKLANLDDKTVYTSADAMPAVSGAVTYYAVFAKVAGESGWVETAIGNLSASDVFVFSDGSYALNNDGGTGNAPTANAITVSDGKITSAVADNLKWNISGNATDGYTFYPNGSTTTWLYCNTTAASSSNNNMRVGTGDRKVFVFDNAGVLVTDDNNVDRYLCRYTTQDFRGYINKTTANTTPVVPKFYKYSAGSASDYMTTCAAPTCEDLGTPSVTVTNKTYNSAKLTWEAVANADKYLVKFNGVDQTATSNLYFDATDLDAETQYTYQVKALAAANQDDWCDGAFSAEANFTTEAAPTAHLTLIDINGTHASSGDYAVGTPFNLPTTAATCSKTFVGWDPDDECATAPTYTKGQSFTFENQTGVTLYAVYATAANVTAVFNAGEYAAANSWENGVAYSDFEIDGVTFTANGGGNNGKYYTSDATWRFYDGGGSVSLSATGNILSVSSNPSMSFTINGTSASSAGAARYKSITVTVEGNYSNYSTACVEQLAEPTFTVEGGEYATGQSVTIEATNEAAIYYSMDGNAPTIDEQHLYDGSAISLSARGAYTIKAIAVKAGFENSEVAEATYKINPPFATVTDLFTYLGESTTYNLGDVTVTGYVSEIVTEYSSQHDNVSYNISDDGKTTSAQLQSYRGKGVKTGEETYEDADLVAVGDKVTIIGTYKVFGSSNTKELDAGNYIITRVAKGNVESLTVSGTAAKTEYSNGDAFETTGLVATATYESGYAAEVTPDSWAADPATVTTTCTVAVTATVGSVTSLPYNVDVTVSAKALVSIAIGTASYNIYTGQALPQPTVTATYSEGEPEDVSASAEYDTESVFDTNTPDEYTITVSYTFGGETKTATYTVTVADYANDAAHPYTPAQARDLTINVIGSTKSTKNIYVQGIVSRANNVSSGKQRYWISIDGETTSTEFEVYNGLYLNGAAFTNTNKLLVGDEVIVFGKVIYYNSTTPEFATGESQLYSLARTPNFEIDDVASLEVGADDLAEGDLDITTLSDGEITFLSGNTEIATIVENAIHAVAPGSVTITANLAADGIYKAASTTFNVTVVPQPTKYAISFDDNGADGGEAPEDIADQVENAEVTLPANAWTKEGYKFDGWKVINNSTSAEITVTAGKFSMPASAVTIQAQWAEIPSWAYVYDNNVAVVHGGTSGVDNGTITISETAYKLVKAGAGSNTGTIKVTVPAGATDLHFHAFAWGGKTAKIQIAGVENASISVFDLAGEAGAAGSGNDFTLQGVPVDQYYHVSFDAVADETEIVFSKATGSADNRFFFYGVNQEGGDFGSYQRSTTSGNYGTICLPYAGTISGATLFEIADYENDMIYCDEITDGKMIAGRPYIFYATSGSLNVAYTSGVAAAYGSHNGLYGFYDLEDENATLPLADDASLGNYILYSNQYWLVSGRAATIANFRAYIKIGMINYVAPAPGCRRVGMAVNGKQTPTGFESINASEKPMKLMIDGQIFILRGQKMYDATGRLVK